MVNNNNKRFIQHNIYFVAWLINAKEVEVEKNTNGGFFILGLSQELYQEYKTEYKNNHRDLLKKINKTVKELS